METVLYGAMAAYKRRHVAHLSTLQPSTNSSANSFWQNEILLCCFVRRRSFGRCSRPGLPYEELRRRPALGTALPASRGAGLRQPDRPRLAIWCGATVRRSSMFLQHAHCARLVVWRLCAAK